MFTLPDTLRWLAAFQTLRGLFQKKLRFANNPSPTYYLFQKDMTDFLDISGKSVKRLITIKKERVFLCVIGGYLITKWLAQTFFSFGSARGQRSFYPLSFFFYHLPIILTNKTRSGFLFVIVFLSSCYIIRNHFISNSLREFPKSEVDFCKYSSRNFLNAFMKSNSS